MNRGDAFRKLVSRRRVWAGVLLIVLNVPSLPLLAARALADASVLLLIRAQRGHADASGPSGRTGFPSRERPQLLARAAGLAAHARRSSAMDPAVSRDRATEAVEATVWP